MINDRAIRRIIVNCLLEALDPKSQAVAMLMKVDAGDFHMLPIDKMSEAEKADAERLVAHKMLKKLSANAKFPERYVLTANGSHALGTFDSDTYDEEKDRKRLTGSYLEADLNANRRIDLAAERDRLMRTWSRQKLIDWLCWNDPNGLWRDKDMIANDMDPMSQDEAVDEVMAYVEEEDETPEEMMQGSLKANPQRYPKPEEFDRFLKK
jgi:hypothetical protein